MNGVLDDVFRPTKPVYVLGEGNWRDFTSAKLASLVSSACIFA